MNDTESGRRVPDIDLFERFQCNGALIGAHERARNGQAQNAPLAVPLSVQ
jgi:hypothetical protein